MSRHDVTASPELQGWVERSFGLIAHGLRSEFDQFVHPDATNREARAEPPAARQQGPDDAVFYRPDGSVDQVFPATGKTFAVTHSHWYRMRDGLVFEHWANRDDLAMATQLGWVPPSPLYVVRMKLATRRARRHEARA